MGNGSFFDFWVAVKIKHRTLIRAGICHLSVVSNPNGGESVVVVCPGSHKFSIQAKALGAKYRVKTYCWHFPGDSWDQTYRLCLSVFGPEAIRVDSRRALRPPQ